MVSNYTTIPAKNFIDGEMCTAQSNMKSTRKFSKIFIRVSLGIMFVSVFVLNLTLFVMTMNKGYRIHEVQNEKIHELQEEINVLRHDVDMLKHVFVDDHLMEELSEFKKEIQKDYYDDMDNESSSDVVSPFDTDNIDFDDNYDLSYDDTLLDDELQSSTTSSSSPTTARSVDENNRSKREVLAATIDGVPIIAESYAERKQRNRTLHRTGEGLKLYETLGKNTEAPGGRNVDNRKHSTTHTFKTSGWTSKTFVNSGRNDPVLPGAVPTPVMSRNSRVMQTNEDKNKAFRRIVKKTMLKSSGATASQLNSQESIGTTHVNVQRPRHRHHRLNRKSSNLETMDERHSSFHNSFPAAHFYGDTSKYHNGNHHNYRGNHHLAHPQGHYIDWLPSNWVKSLGMERHFHMHNGVLTIKEAGLYFIYAQIFYVDEHDVNTYKIYKNNTEIAQCTTMTHTQSGSTPIIKRNTCYTAAMEYLEEGDKLMIRDLESMRYVYFQNGKSFFGLYKISDAKIK